MASKKPVDFNTCNFTTLGATMSFPMAIALTTWNRADNALPDKTDGMVRKALQARRLLDDETRLPTPRGQRIIDALAEVVAEAAQCENHAVMLLTNPAPDASDEANTDILDMWDLRNCVLRLLVTAGFAQWGERVEGVGRYILVSERCIRFYGAHQGDEADTDEGPSALRAVLP